MARQDKTDPGSMLGVFGVVFGVMTCLLAGGYPLSNDGIIPSDDPFNRHRWPGCCLNSSLAPSLGIVSGKVERRTTGEDWNQTEDAHVTLFRVCALRAPSESRGPGLVKVGRRD